MTECTPILSICIPTFNRANTLDMLLENIAIIKADAGSAIEVCISNNCSTDNTKFIVEKWSRSYEIKLFNQLENIGGTKNVQQVARMSSGKWVLIIGDDDGIDPAELSKLIRVLTDAPKDIWIILRTVNKNKQSLYFEEKDVGLYSSASFLRKLEKSGVMTIGFIGSHVISREVMKGLDGLSANDIRPWPHIALLFRNLASVRVNIINCTLTIQSAFGTQLFWRSGDWVTTKMRIIDLLGKQEGRNNLLDPLCNRLQANEMRRWSLVKEIIIWRLTEADDFIWQAQSEYQSRLKSLVSPRVSHYFILALIIALRKLNARLIFAAFFIAGRSSIFGKYNREKELLKSHDVASRKI
jgi:glycosyltransferase involved in cell wall biosynthesis